MQLSDVDLRRELDTDGPSMLVVHPLADDAIQPASIDLRLGPHFAGLTVGKKKPLDPARDNTAAFTELTVPDCRPLSLAPGMCALGSTVEHVHIPDGLVGYVHGKSSLGRLFLLVHVTAGLIDSGFAGHITLELVNLSPRPLLLWPGMKIAQLTVHTLTRPAGAPYGTPGVGSHYQDQGAHPTLSRSTSGSPTASPADAVPAAGSEQHS